MRTIKVNGQDRQINASDDTPLLYVLRGELDVMTSKFGCGLAQCGACSVLLGDEEIRACVTPISALEGKEVTTVDGLPARWAKRNGGSVIEGYAASGARSVDRRTGSAVRHLPVRDDDQSHRVT